MNKLEVGKFSFSIKKTLEESASFEKDSPHTKKYASDIFI